MENVEEIKKIPEIDLKLKTIEVKSGTTYKLTVRNVFYVGVIGKIKTFFIWLFYKKNQTFKEYLESRVEVIYDQNDINSAHAYHSIDAEKELTKILTEELIKTKQ